MSDNPLTKKKKTKAYEVLQQLREVKLKAIKDLKKGATVTISPKNFRNKGQDVTIVSIDSPTKNPEDTLLKVKLSDGKTIEVGIEEISGLEDQI